MKCRLLTDEEGPDPDDSTQTIVVPAGTELEGRMCWIHCVPNGEAIQEVDKATGRITKMIKNGRILAEPADDECREKVEAYYKRNPAAKPKCPPVKPSTSPPTRVDITPTSPSPTPG